MVNEPASQPEAPIYLPLDQIRPCKTNPRTHFDAERDTELAGSIAKHGVLQAILVRPLNGKAGGYELIAGHRRFAAAKSVNLAAIPALSRTLTDAEVLELQLVENLQRTDLHPLEEAEGYRRLLGMKGYDVGCIA